MLPNIHSDEELARYVSVFEALRECIPDAPLRERLTVFLTVDSANALAVLPRALRALPTGSCLGASCCYRSLLSYSPEVTIDEVQFYRDVAATCSYPNQLALLVHNPSPAASGASLPGSPTILRYPVPPVTRTPASKPVHSSLQWLASTICGQGLVQTSTPSGTRELLDGVAVVGFLLQLRSSPPSEEGEFM